jgi:hypothetical protein
LRISPPRRIRTDPLVFPDDTYEIFAHAAEARSNAAGAQIDLGGVFDRNRQVNLSLQPFEFDDTRPDHSGQFNSTNMRRHVYWQTLLQKFDL